MTTYTNGGGGGGASQVGVNAGTTSGGNGGNGRATDISGFSITYSGGGGGALQSSGTAQGIGGSGGGGNGQTSSIAATSGTTNSGGGGGGARSNGLSGGSGVVIVRYPNTYPDLTLSIGIQYATPGSSGATNTNITSAGVYAPSYTPTGFKVYEFRGTGGVPLNISWQD